MSESAEEYLRRVNQTENWQDAAVGARDPHQHAGAQRGGYRPEGAVFEQYALDKARGRTPSGHLAPLCRKERSMLAAFVKGQKLRLVDQLRSANRVPAATVALAADTVVLRAALADRTRWYRDSREDR